MNRILVVEDEFLIALELKDILSTGGFVVEVAYTVEQALERIRGSVFDGVMLDGVLGARSGALVAHELELRAIPYIMCSGSSREEISWAHPKRYLTKPASAVAVIDAVQSWH